MPKLSPEQFIQKWQTSVLKERSGSQEHFIDLCRLLDELTPAEADPQGTWYTFEKEASKQDGKRGWADVYKRGFFAWEYKGKNKNLDKAFDQLQRYKLEHPPLLIVSDMEVIRIYTNFTYMVQEVHQFSLEDLRKPRTLRLLKAVFSDPERLKPSKTRTAVTEEVAREFATLAQKLREQGHAAPKVAHFISQLLFCLFADDAGLFDGRRMLTSILRAHEKRSKLVPINVIRELFQKMNEGGQFGLDFIDRFNGGLFEKIDVLPLDRDDIRLLSKVSQQNWKDIEPSIFGTLFERGLDPDKRSQLGAHYTDPQSIMRLVEPVVLRPLRADWAETRAEIEQVLKKSKAKKKIPKEARDLFHGFLQRLSEVRVLDPACGSGNFLYLVLSSLKDLEHQVNLEAEQLAVGLGGQFSTHTSPENVLGIEVNPYAAELARVTVWIGHLQWLLGHGIEINRDPVLQPLNQIANKDAIITGKWNEVRWAKADFIVGNPPFLGDKRMINVLGEEYVNYLRHLYKGRIPGGADLVTYWFERARREMEKGNVKAVGLVSTNSIRGGANRKILERIRETGVIFEAWSDEEWVNDGAAVRVSLVCFAQKSDEITLNGKPVNEIYADLTGSGEPIADLTLAKKLVENKNISFQGTIKAGAFDIAGDVAREWLKLPNVNGRPNSDVLRPWANGMDITRRPSDTWIIDFGVDMSEEDASYFEKPFEYVLKNVKPVRKKVRREGHRKYWWRYGETRLGMRKALKPFSRFIATPRVAKHRIFVWMDKSVLPDSATVAIARDDDTSFGILHSRFHEIWSLGLCTWLGKGNDPRYTPSTTFETFPFPEGLSPNIPATEYADNKHAQAIADAAKKLNTIRQNWLNPPEWVRREPEIVAGYPDRIIPIDDEAAKQLKKRTLTNLYNERPPWLANLHNKLDEAVANAYGWSNDLSDDEILQKLLELNLQRSENE